MRPVSLSFASAGTGAPGPATVAPAAGGSFKVRVNTEPTPGSLSQPRSPLSSWAACLQMARPRPVPP